MDDSKINRRITRCPIPVNLRTPTTRYGSQAKRPIRMACKHATGFMQSLSGDVQFTLQTQASSGILIELAYRRLNSQRYKPR